MTYTNENLSGTYLKDRRTEIDPRTDCPSNGALSDPTGSDIVLHAGDVRRKSWISLRICQRLHSITIIWVAAPISIQRR